MASPTKICSKTFVITSRQPSRWESCRIISTNLRKAYRTFFKSRCTFVAMSERPKLKESWFIAQKIMGQKPCRLVFMDHKPHPGHLIRALTVLYPKGHIPPLFIHIYGEFSHQAKVWLGLERELKDLKITFIVASIRQMALLQRFLKGNARQIMVSPFFVDTDRFRFSQDKRKVWRRKLSLKNNDFALVYAGRLSLQKNISEVIKAASRLAKHSSRPIKFFCAGDFDHLGSPLFGIKTKKIKSGILKLSHSKIENFSIELLGPLDHSELTGLYNAADCYINLSTHHDEDFGMAPAEALCSGCPVILTNWGGFSSHFLMNEACVLTLVKISGLGPKPETKRLPNLILSRMEREFDRKSISKVYQQNYSISNHAVFFSKIFGGDAYPFRGFSPLLRSHNLQLSQKKAYQNLSLGRRSLYFRIYSAYMEAP